MPATAKGYPYPAGSTSNNVPADLQALAAAIEAAPGIPALTQAQIDALSGGAKTAGWLVFNTTTGRLQRWNGSAWVVNIEEGVATSGLVAILTPNAQAGNYTLTNADISRVVEMSGGGTLTIPAGLTPVGAMFTALQTGASQVTLAAGAGVTLNATPGLKLRAQWSPVTLWQRAADSWVAMGDLVA